ncbi:HU family DNA-binding protein [Ureibacillus chungkukjangi]|uniref:HU family DNA-binding protein n=1 Tax=Ureibacillus chungkukjangi TaxID=1202712 RepID=UPI0020400551|nr:HU family DNA-binding protein [Ureibacillus chungkukjangi]MCM3387313.1 HU family DNA-binding protein [Ureibacillus chungkukjangi]
MANLKKVEFTELVQGFYTERTNETITKKELEGFIDDVFTAVEQALLDGYDVTLGSIGKLKQKERAARIGRNPSTGESIDIAASKNIKLDLSKGFKSELNA